MLTTRILEAMLLTALTSLAAPLPSSQPQSHILTVAHQELGLLTIAFDPFSSQDSPLRILRTTEAGIRPGWLCDAGKSVYAVSRTGYPDGEAEEGGVFAFKEELKKRELKPIGDVSSGGEGGCHCDVSSDGKLLAVANIDGSSVSIHPRYKNGTLDVASHHFTYTLSSPGPGHDDSQIQSNPHQTIFSPSGRYMFVPDRGADRVYVYHISKDKVVQLEDIEVEPGSGPRHAEFWKVSEAESLMILLNELGNVLRVYKVTETSKPAGLQVKLLQTISTLEEGLGQSHPDGIDLAAEVAISPDGKFVYASNRNTASFDSDFIAIYSFDVKSNKQPLQWIGRNDTMGKIPRHFSLSGGKAEYLAVLNQVSNDLQIFERDTKAGVLKDRLGKLQFGNLTTDLDVGPIAVLWN